MVRRVEHLKGKKVSIPHDTEGLPGDGRGRIDNADRRAGNLADGFRKERIMGAPENEDVGAGL